MKIKQKLILKKIIAPSLSILSAIFRKLYFGFSTNIKNDFYVRLILFKILFS